jgi:peptidyl-dipeptidase Dcp
MATLRQISFGLLDMTYHGKSQIIEDVKAFEKQAMAALVCILM